MLARLNEDYPKISLVSANELSELINFIIGILNIRIDSTNEEIDRMDEQMMHVGSLIKTQYSYLTIPEVQEAMKMYVSRQFQNIKPFRLLDCISISEVLTAYTDYRADKLRDYDQKKAKLQLEATLKKDETEILKNRKALIKEIFEEVKSKGFYYDACYLYDELYEKGLIQITNQEKRELYQKELQVYIPKEKEEIRKKKSMNTKHLIKDFEERIKQRDPIPYVQNMCRSKLVSEFVKGLDSIEEFENIIL